MQTNPVSSPYRITNVNWITTVVMSLFHIGAIAALFFITWQAVLAAFLLYWFCVGWGIGMGYHRLHTHRSYKCPRWFEYVLGTLGTMTLEGGPIFWVATHRIHHQRSDHDGDPHSPREGGFWAHVGWIMFGRAMHNATQQTGKYAPDLARDPFYRWLNTYHYLPLTASAVVLFLLGGFPMVLWGVFFRVVFGLHCTWLVNSATHMWGRRRFRTNDDSRNNWWVALLTFGEGWHNNHHAHPSSARHGMAWYELDFTWIHLNIMKFFGVVRDLQAIDLDSELGRRKAA